jgi:hypothetical protein
MDPEKRNTIDKNKLSVSNTQIGFYSKLIKIERGFYNIIYWFDSILMF